MWHEGEGVMLGIDEGMHMARAGENYSEAPWGN